MPLNSIRRFFCHSMAAVFTSAFALHAFAAEQCPHGDLDPMFCDVDGDMVADPPTDPKKFRNPRTLVFAFTPVEDPAIYDRLFQPFMAHLTECTEKKTVFLQVQSNSAEVEAMRSGRLHIAAFSSGPTTFAVNIAGAVPFAIRGTEKGPEGVHLAMIVRKDSPYQKLEDLKGKKIAHTSPSSNSGNLAPRALFPKEGLVPDKDYAVVYSGKHDQSILGVKSGDYDAAPVADDVLRHMIERGLASEDDFRVLYTSEMFPTDSYAYAHDLDPELVKKIKQCFFDYRIPPDMAKGLGGDRFLPIDYKEGWKLVREVAKDAGEDIGRSGYDTATSKEKAKSKK